MKTAIVLLLLLATATGVGTPALAVVNETAMASGVNPAESLVTITEEATPGGRLWRIQYGPRDYLHRRGGDMRVVVDESTYPVQRVLKGQ